MLQASWIMRRNANGALERIHFFGQDLLDYFGLGLYAVSYPVDLV